MSTRILSGMQAEWMDGCPWKAWVHEGCRPPRANEGVW